MTLEERVVDLEKRIKTLEDFPEIVKQVKRKT